MTAGLASNRWAMVAHSRVLVGAGLISAAIACDSALFQVATVLDASAPSDVGVETGDPCVSFEVSEVPLFNSSIAVALPYRNAAIVSHGDPGTMYRVTMTSEARFAPLEFPDFHATTAFIDERETVWMVGCVATSTRCDTSQRNTNEVALMQQVDLAASPPTARTTTIGVNRLMTALDGARGGAPFELFGVGHVNSSAEAVHWDAASGWTSVLPTPDNVLRMRGQVVWVGPAQAYFVPSRGGCGGQRCVYHHLEGRTAPQSLPSGIGFAALAHVDSIGPIAGTNGGRLMTPSGGRWSHLNGLDPPLALIPGDKIIYSIAPFEGGLLYFAEHHIGQYRTDGGYCVPQLVGRDGPWLGKPWIAIPVEDGFIVVGEKKGPGSGVMRIRIHRP